MKHSILALALATGMTILPGQANAACRWDGLYAANVVSQVADWRTTRDAIKGGAVEANPIASAFMGSNPTGSDVDKYFVGVLAVNALINCFAGDRFRNGWMFWGAIGHSIAAGHNISIGARLRF